MATAYITEYRDMANASGGPVQVAKSPALAGYTIAISATATTGTSAPFQTDTRFIRFHTDAICSVAIATSPTATTSSKRVAADQTEYYGVVPGDRISVISNT